MVRLYIHLVKRINQGAGAIAGALMIYMAGHILLEIVMRFFNSSTFVLNEFVGYAVATMTFFGLGYTLERAGLIRVDMLTGRLSEGANVLIDLLVSSACLLLFSWLSWFWGQNVVRSFSRNIHSDSLANTPLWIPEGLVLTGLVIFCLSLLARVLSLALYRQPPCYLDGEPQELH